jgi:hypothetical protein
MGTFLTNPNWAARHTDAKSVFDKFADQIDASVNAFNRLRGGQGLQCERTPNRIAVYKALHPGVTVELEFDEVAGMVRMSRKKLEDPSSGHTGAVVTDLRYAVDQKSQVYLDRADYCRLARQALRPLMDAFE